MSIDFPNLITKVRWNLPWLVRYPFVRGKEILRSAPSGKKHVVFIISNHFEPAWARNGMLDIDSQLRRLDDYYELARKTGNATLDVNGKKFRHTNFYPIEQYDKRLLDKMAEMQAEGLGDTEIHLHHGVEKPDTADNLRKTLIEYRDIFAERHRLLSKFEGDPMPKWAFVHGNLALANSCGGRFCGVNEEMQILAETGCYADFTLPSAPDQSQVAVINQIYECGMPMDQPVPHRAGKSLRVNSVQPKLPIIFQGPLVFNWSRKVKGIPLPRIEDGALVSSQPKDLERFRRWLSANITIEGKEDWVFVKLYCHGFFDHDQSDCIGEGAQKFFGEILENSEKTGEFDVYFATAREAFNMALAAIDGKEGTPGEYRDYRLKAIMDGPAN